MRPFEKKEGFLRGVSVAKGSVLYISAHLDDGHEARRMYRPWLDPPPDYDLNRLIETTGEWAREFFCKRIVDAGSEDRAYPADPNGLSAIVVGGSLLFWSAARGPLDGWQEELIAFVRKAILDWGLGYLGLCAGAQIGLRALGGTVMPNPPTMELNDLTLAGDVVVRTAELVLTEEGIRDPVFAGCPPRFAVHESHGDYLAELPDDVVVLAESSDVPHQALAWYERVRLFQPHPELSLSFMRRVLHMRARGATSHAEAERLQRLSASLRETRVANERIVVNFLRLL